ncbi:MAG: hypothetical protein SFU91_11465 [Chloroherpetonaceae bacterium]|nr:hypothetical protein [Chloroherpetonaceae bacterium]
MPKIIIERGRTIEFQELPNYSIALDGYVQGPWIDNKNNRYSFDHHDLCIRHATRSSCEQVLDALLLGFDPQEFNIYINDIDGDTALTVWLLLNPTHIFEKRVRELVEVVGKADAYGPAYPTSNYELLTYFRKEAMKSEYESKRNKLYQSADLNKLLDDCLEGISALISQNTDFNSTEEESVKSYQITYKNDLFVMALSDDFIFDELYKNGFNRAVCYKYLADGSIAYTIGKKSEFVSNFPIGPVSEEGTILYTLNKLEPGWGGGSTIGGAPRYNNGSRSILKPEQIIEIIRNVLKSN